MDANPRHRKPPPNTHQDGQNIGGPTSSNATGGAQASQPAAGTANPTLEGRTLEPGLTNPRTSWPTRNILSKSFSSLAIDPTLSSQS